MMKKILLIFGGRSGEHEVSVRSAKSVQEHIDKSKFELSYCGITKEGRWVFGSTIDVLTENDCVNVTHATSLSKSLAQSTDLIEKIDCVFPIIHGTYGEDGRLQGLLDMLNLPYVGSGVLGSAVAMDKGIQKMLCAQAGLPQTSFMTFTYHEWDVSDTKVLQRIEDALSYPLFIKPANLGSSVGISKANNKKGLEEAIEVAFTFDLKIIIEEGIQDAIEIEVAVLGHNDPKASVCGSIEPKSEFYDYETKYITDDIETHIPANISDESTHQIQDMAVDVFKLLHLSGLARIDFFYQPNTHKIFLNETNTLPGFTSISMFPKLWEATGISHTDLITKLIECAEERFQESKKLEHSIKHT